MKLRLFVTILFLIGTCVAEPRKYDKELLRAISCGAEFDVTFMVVDDEGNSVRDARCQGWIYRERDVDHGSCYSRVTDQNGCFNVCGLCSEWFSVVITKDGYYTTMIEVRYPSKGIDVPIKNDQWQPFQERRVVVLKKIRNPHKMIGPERTPQRKILIYDQWVGFDLERGGFLPPMGDGVVSDACIRFHREGASARDWSKTMEVSFSDHPFAGVYRRKKDMWSDLKSEYIGDTNAVYDAHILFKYEKAGPRIKVKSLAEDEYLVFRTRTKVDQDGRLVSARYGKLYGPWWFEDAGGVRVKKIFMNSEDNDTNLEEEAK